MIAMWWPWEGDVVLKTKPELRTDAPSYTSHPQSSPSEKPDVAGSDRSMISMSADPAGFPQSSHKSVATCCALRAVFLLAWIDHGGNAVAGAMFNFSIKVDTR